MAWLPIDCEKVDPKFNSNGKRVVLLRKICFDPLRDYKLNPRSNGARRVKRDRTEENKSAKKRI